METIQAKMDGFSTAMKNQLSFNKALETQLAQLVAATPATEQGKIPGQPESTLESVNVINAMWKESLSRTPLSYAEKFTRPRRGAWGELAATIREDPRTLVISCSIFDYVFDHPVGVYRQAYSGIPLAVRFVGRDRSLWNSMVQGTQRFRVCVIPYVLCGLYCLRC